MKSKGVLEAEDRRRDAQTRKCLYSDWLDYSFLSRIRKVGIMELLIVSLYSDQQV